MDMCKDERILVFASGRDASLTRDILTRADLPCLVCGSAEDLCREMAEGAGAVVLAEEALTLANVVRVAECLEEQPPWSDLPVIIVAGQAGKIGKAVKTLDVMGNVSVLPRPLPIDTLITAVRTSLRARRRQYEVRNLLSDREEADHRKDAFLAMLAHELRNPLAPIRSAVQILRLIDVDNPDITEVREVLGRQVSHMARLIDDLLDVSRISRGTIELRKQSLDLTKSAEQAANSVKALMDSKGLELSVALPGEPNQIEADATRLEQVLVNVLNNAAKYTDAGGRIAMSVSQEGAMGVVRVLDTGIGIDAEVLPRVFDLFVQADRTLDRTQGGLGIGLTVVKSLVEQHGGTVEVQSDGLGRGTELVLRFPVAAHTSFPEPGHDGSTGRGRGLRVLIVEDNRDAATMLARVCRLQGHEVRVVHDGQSAIAVARDFWPEAVLSDIGLRKREEKEKSKMRLKRIETK